LGDFRGIRRKIVEIHFSSVLGQARKQNLGRSSSAISCCARQSGGVSSQTGRISHLILFCTSVRLYQLLSLCVLCMNRTSNTISPTSQLRTQQQTTVFDRQRFLITRWRLFPLRTTCICRAVNRNHSDAHILLRLRLIPVETICRYPQSFRSYLGTIWRSLKPVVKSLPP
jgi:hypothetical protein